MKKEDFNIDFSEKPRITGEEGKIHKQCSVCNGFKELTEFRHKKKNGTINKVCRRCLDRSCEYHRRNLIMIQNNNIAEDIDERDLKKG